MTPFHDLKEDVISSKQKEAMKNTGSIEDDEDSGTNSIESVDDHTDKTTQYLATGLVTIGAFSAGTFLSWTSSALPLLRQDPNIHTNSTEESWIACLLNLGAFLGAIPTGLIAERFGRKKTLLFLAVPMLVSWLMIALSTSVYCYYVGRFVGGIAVGALSVAVPPYVAEMAQPGVRSILAQGSQIQLTAGILTGYAAGLAHDVTTISLILLVFPALYFIGFIFMPESPVYLMSQGKVEEARNSLIYLRGAGCDIDEELLNMKNYITESISRDGTFKDLIATHSNIKALIIAFTLMILQQMTGITTIIFFLQSILVKANVNKNMTVIIGMAQVLSTYLSASFFMKTGRRPMMIISNSIMGLSVFLLGVYFHLQATEIVEAYWWVPVVCLSLFISFYSIGVGPIPWLMLRELFPINIKRRATAISAGVNWFMAFVMTGMFNTMLESVQIGWVLCNYSFICVVSAIFVYYFVPETRGKTIEEVHKEFSKGQRPHRHIIEIESVSIS